VFRPHFQDIIASDRTCFSGKELNKIGSISDDCIQIFDILENVEVNMILV
jgi:hypothetical protein